ncbi:HAD family hydrolase [Planctomycetes bacterium K23_9]|uniref:Alpha-D-glucose-1-phosphate phosphatase YihX n=1 Tax=Stieleria marina TaxID=1930275 RepID=A0A517NMY7_9BACT|nr:Alpha-D-glucose-1-phosphate phosphatase YihX [Planctomycetes bacterium K23_9]
MSETNAEIQFVYFDLGNILVSFDPQIACDNIAKLFDVSSERAQAAVYDSGLEDRYEHGEISEAGFLAEVRRHLGGEVDGRDVPLQSFLNALGDMFKPIESMTRTIQQVRQAGYRIGILSNTCFAHWDWVARQNWPATKGPFDTTILSYEVGAMKPDAKIYAAAEAAANVDPQHILFVDDRQENIDAAISRGWQAAQCFGGAELEEQLRRFGVL